MIDLVQQRAGPDRLGAVRLQDADQVIQRVAGVHDVFDDQHVLALDAAAHVHDEPHRAALAARAVA